MIQQHTVTEGNLRVVKCTDDFGGPNMWNLYFQNVDGWWESIQWGDVHKFQSLFRSKLPVYKEVDKKVNYQLA